jgi:hypothetical protein
MFLFSIMAAIIVYLPVISNSSIQSVVVAPPTPIVLGTTFTYTEGATCIIKQNGVMQTVVSNDHAWCDYTLTPNSLFEVEVYETSDSPQLPGAVWAFTCMAASVAEEYPQNVYGVGCAR